MADKINWGIIGTGTIAGKFATGLSALPDANLLAVGSRTQANADNFAQKFNATRAYPNYEQLARDADIDVVYIATPHPFHMENTILCLQNKRAVLCEKPFSINAAQAEKMIVAAQDAKVFLMEAMWTRFIPAVVKLRELLQQGVLGDIKMLEADFGYNFPWDPTSRIFDIDLGGGALLDVGIYPLSFASMIYNSQPIKIASLAHIGQTGVDEQTAMVLQYDKGQLAILSCAAQSQTPGSAVIAGSKGFITMHRPFWRSTGYTLHLDGTDEQVFDIPFESNGYNYQAAEVHNCLRVGKLQSDIMPHDETLAIMKTMDSIRSQWGLKYPCE